MVVALNRDGRIIGVTTDETLISQMALAPTVHTVRRIGETESVIADDQGFSQVPATLRMECLKRELKTHGVDVDEVLSRRAS